MRGFRGLRAAALGFVLSASAFVARAGAEIVAVAVPSNPKRRMARIEPTATRWSGRHKSSFRYKSKPDHRPKRRKAKASAKQRRRRARAA